MSRSTKKVGGFIDRSPFMKNQDNRRLRTYARDALRVHFVQDYEIDYDISDECPS